MNMQFGQNTDRNGVIYKYVKRMIFKMHLCQINW